MVYLRLVSLDFVRRILMNTLKTLLQQQKRLITIFLLTIVLPSVALSIFGILAIRNEKYRREQLILAEQQNAMLLLKRQFSGQMKSVESLLASTARLPAFLDREYSAIRQHINVSLTGNAPIDQVFILFEDGQSFFPLLQPAPDVFINSDPVLTAEQQNLLTQAWQAEFTRQDYKAAASLYEGLAVQAAGNNTRAQMLNHLARAQRKSGKTASAIRTYTKIIEQYPASLTSDRMPLALTAEMQIVDCDRISGNTRRALDGILILYERICNHEWVCTENQFLMYAEMAREIAEELLNGNGNQEKRRYYATLQEVYQRRVEQWKVRRQIETEIIPALKEMQSRSGPEPLQLSRSIQGSDFLISAIPVSGLLCVKWDNDRLIREWLKPIVDNLMLNERFNVIITDLSGKTLLGEEEHENGRSSATGEFDAFFPPWKIRMVRTGSNARIGIELYKSYYFWSILTLLIILIFGTFLIIQTLVREREVMTMKSEFVSSVSHELKTPLTSIRALTERLLAGKVRSPEKMHQYFSVIDQDANKLARLVKNILDFSKIEAGKKEYHFEATDITAWLDETIDDFCKDHIHHHIEIRKYFDRDIPSVAMDRDALSQCLNNLLDNAIKFSPGSKSVVIYLKKNPESIIIRVKDRGIGILEEDLDRIFDKFYQGTPSIQQSVKGTGLGLALVKHAVEAHGGRIEVESSPGQGSTFTLFLPVFNPNL
jgi:signal transduction histidine kinase